MPNGKVIDLSHHNVIPQDLHAAKAAGVMGVIHKATEGATWIDEKYGGRRYLARQAGLLFGAYHFLRPGDLRAQARAFVDYAQPTKWMLLAADHEDPGVSINDLLAWLDEVETLTENRPVVYSGHVLKDQLGGERHSILNADSYRLWLAQYGPAAELPPGWDRYFLWQWTDRGTVAGIEPPVDLNDYQGDDDELIEAWTAGDEEAQGPEPPPKPSRNELSPEEFQIALADAGFYTGEIDGLSGPQTRAAVDDWFEDGEELELQED